MDPIIKGSDLYNGVPIYLYTKGRLGRRWETRIRLKQENLHNEATENFEGTASKFLIIFHQKQQINHLLFMLIESK